LRQSACGFPRLTHLRGKIRIAVPRILQSSTIAGSVTEGMRGVFVLQYSHFGVRLAAAFFLAACGMAQPAAADGLVAEIKVGVLAHDVPDLWSGFQRE
jgi:hypothetical protein